MIPFSTFGFAILCCKKEQRCIRETKSETIGKVLVNWFPQCPLMFLNYICTYHFNNPHTDVIHPILIFFHRNPPLNPHHLEIFFLFVLDNITLCSSHPKRNKIRIVQSHNATKYPPNTPHTTSSLFHMLNFVQFPPSRNPCIWIVQHL